MLWNEMHNDTMPNHWTDGFTPLLQAETIAKRVQELGRQITQDYQGKDVCLVAVLKGSFPFFADLVRTIELPIVCEFIGISSYGHQTKTSGVVQITHDLTQSVAGMDVLLVEDIVDTGLTMRYLLDNFAARKANSVKVCTLLSKPSKIIVPVPLDYVGFTIPDAFVVGYGLDWQNRYRNLPFVGIKQREPANVDPIPTPEKS